MHFEIYRSRKNLITIFSLSFKFINPRVNLVTLRDLSNRAIMAQKIEATHLYRATLDLELMEKDYELK